MSMISLCRTIAAALALIATTSGCDAQAAPASVPSRPFLVVANQRTSVATFVDIAAGRVTHVDATGSPHEVAVAPDGRVAALTIPNDGFRGGRRVVVFDLASASIARTVNIGEFRNPHGIAFLSDTVALIGTLAGTSAVWVDVKNGRVLGSVDGLPANPYIVSLTRAGRAYVSSPHASRVSEIDLASRRLLRTIEIPDDPAGITVSPDGKELYAAVWTQSSGGGIAVYDLERGAVTAMLPATQPRRLTVTADARHVVVTDRDHVRIVDRATRQVRSVALGANAGGSGVACSPDSTRCYVALSQAGEIVEIDVQTARVLRRFPAQRGVDGLAYVP